MAMHMRGNSNLATSLVIFFENMIANANNANNSKLAMVNGF
jgi:hypothetical protein